jgi:hypothetical protein
MSNISKIIEKREQEMGMKISKTYFINKILYDYIENSQDKKENIAVKKTKEEIKIETILSDLTKEHVQRIFNRPGAKWKDDRFYTWNYNSNITNVDGSFWVDEHGNWTDQMANESGNPIDLYMMVMDLVNGEW